MSLYNAIEGMSSVYQPGQIQKQLNEQTRKIGANELQQAHRANRQFGIQDTAAVKNVSGVRAPTMGRMVESAIDYVDAKQDYAAAEVRALQTGESDNLHRAVMAMEESGVAFNLMLETRNKLMEGYQELMRLRV